MRKELEVMTKKALIDELCKEPYAGSFLVYMMDNFQELISSRIEYINLPGSISPSASPSRAARQANHIAVFEGIW